jgi:hypothetical protein
MRTSNISVNITRAPLEAKMPTIGFTGYYVKKYIRSAVARCIRETHSKMLSLYGSGKDNARLAGAESALFEFAKNMYGNIYGITVGMFESEDFETFINECHL